ncbi:phosphatase [Burkholderia multivorans]|uniref:phosphatase n=1 Tax=Burkholderia multivorans TaxID=87883 RepID=UPI000CFED18D|nr:phosphatase [Burkholderia multivorans]MBJ9654130.1 phosphatase [Burkholderia multivorans]MBR8045241.1 phosphatase [Burkholderia multivorans]MBU9443394.1 phosphatase [Burkholderia multivorans]MBU9454153.1 phosphatase [Burkholderia multivorans]MCA8312814.1 phosphatase [Burkholderia multivorans]
MVIEAIVTRLDAAFEQIEATPDSREARHQRDAIIQWLDSASEHGYRLGLVTTLPAARLSDMFEGQFGRANLDRFSVVVSDADQRDRAANQHPFDVALQALGVPPERAAALASSEPERREAENFGLSHCMRITDTVRAIAPAGLH